MNNDQQQNSGQTSMHTEHHPAPEHPMMGGQKGSLSFAGIDWKKEVMNAIEILKLNKMKMQEVAKDNKATTVGLIFIIVPQIISLIIAVLFTGQFIGWIHGSYILGMITPFLFVYAAHFTATKFFQGKGDLIAYFRVVSYTNIISVITIVIALLMYAGKIDLLGLASLIMLAIGIWMLIVSYHLLMENYHTTSQNTIIVLIIAFVAVSIIVLIINRILFPNPLEQFSSELNNAFKNYPSLR